MSAMPNQFPADAVLTRAELAAWLRVSVATTYRLDGIPCRRVGREYRFPVAAVLRWLEGGGEASTLDVPASRSQPGVSSGRGEVFAMSHRRGGVA